MGWGLIIKNVYLSRVRKEEVKDVIETCDKDIQHAKERILMLAAAGPGLAPRGEQEEDPMTYVHSEVEQAVSEIEDAAVKRFLCHVADDNPEDVEADD